jgi:hypothetical protein
MRPPHRSEPDLPGFQLPAEHGQREDWERAIDKLNAIPMPVEQLARGYAESLQDGFPCIRTLRAFCETEGLLPADVAAEAILVRWYPVMDAQFHGGINIWEGEPCFAETVGLRELSIRELLHLAPSP